MYILFAKFCLLLVYPIGFIETTVRFFFSLFKHAWNNYKVELLMFNRRWKDYWKDFE